MGVKSLLGSLIFPAEATPPTAKPSAAAPSQKPPPRTSKRLVSLCLLVLIALTGCFPLRQTPPESHPPSKLVAYYLRSIFDPSMQRDVYDLLTAKARDAVSFGDFVSLRKREVSHILGIPSATDTRISVSILDQYTFSGDHSVVFALLRIRFPYSIGERETYRLVRLHCYKEGEQWAISPFMHSETGTVIFVPTRMRGPLWRISQDRERITALVINEISSYEEPAVPLPEKPVADSGQTHPPGESSPGAADIDAGPTAPDGTAGEGTPPIAPDVPETEAPKLTSRPLAIEKKVDAMLSIGKLCYEAGKIDVAEDTFRRVLTLDADNAIAKDYLSRCQNYRLLQKEKEEAMRLMEELLRLDSGGRSEKQH